MQNLYFQPISKVTVAKIKVIGQGQSYSGEVFSPIDSPVEVQRVGIYILLQGLGF